MASTLCGKILEERPPVSIATRVIDINNAVGEVVALDWLVKAEPVHRQLRAHLPEDYIDKMRRVFAEGGRMCVAAHGDAVVGVAVYRVYENTCDGVHMYVDDLIADEAKRSGGIGKTLMDHMQDLSRKAGCESYNLDSGLLRNKAHKFYFREGMAVIGFHFGKPLK